MVSGAVRVGIDCLRRDGFGLLRGARVGLVTNHTGLSADGVSTIDLLHDAPDVRLVALFGPEHGVRGTADEEIADGVDNRTGLPVYSLYGERKAPSAEQLQGIDTLVFDIQDIGCRFYTYVSTLGHVLAAAEAAGVRVVVLDRPNPIGGVAVEGPLPDPDKLSFTAFHTVPVRHGMTAGEMARSMAAERFPAVELDIVPCEGWERGQWYDQTGLPWVDPSPNMRSLTAAALYPGIGLLEFTNVSVGRGTPTPFEVFGAPYVDAGRLQEALTEWALPGIAFEAATFTPERSVFAGERCGGLRLKVIDRDVLRPVRVGFAVARELRRLFPEWQTEKLNTLLANDTIRDAVLAGAGQAIEAGCASDEEAFRQRRAGFLLY